MYGGGKRALYGGLALSDRQFLVAAYLTGLTAPDEPPYITTQSQFHVEQGWGADVLYEDDFITAYALGTLPVALSRTGRLYDALTGNLIDTPDAQAVTHFGAIDASNGILFLAGDNGSFWVGHPGSMKRVSNPFFLRMPSGDAALSEQVAWGQSMQPIFAALFQAPDLMYVAGARGFLAYNNDKGFERVSLSVKSHVTGIVLGPDGLIYICGHTPSAFVARLEESGHAHILFHAHGGPKIRAPKFHDGDLYFAAPGDDGGIFVLSGDRLILAPFSNTEQFGSAWHLDQVDDTLWVVYEKALGRIKGGEVRAWLLPEEG